ncbi:MAG TPA: shikimate kinase [Bryobacteraceae bacterium]|jgi:shikimate kinase|nr:shikimate kinase [Bryobacteraceae bacterium]
MTLKLKRTPGLYLVGFMGAGKSTIGAALADELGWPFIDVDAEIEKREGVPISELFAQRGEAAFRDIETDQIRRCIHAVQSGAPSVIALGGGAFTQPRNWDLLEDNGITIWLDCPFEIVCQRLDGDHTRPLAQDRDRFARLFEDRRPLYGRADFHVQVAVEDVDAIVQRILQLPLF